MAARCLLIRDNSRPQCGLRGARGCDEGKFKMARRRIVEVVLRPVPTSNEFTCSDLYLAAYFMTSRVPLIRTERQGPTRVGFVFSSERAAELQKSWFDTTGMVVPLAYADALKNLKDLAASVLRGPSPRGAGG